MLLSMAVRRSLWLRLVPERGQSRLTARMQTHRKKLPSQRRLPPSHRPLRRGRRRLLVVASYKGCKCVKRARRAQLLLPKVPQAAALFQDEMIIDSQSDIYHSVSLTVRVSSPRVPCKAVRQPAFAAGDRTGPRAHGATPRTLSATVSTPSAVLRPY